MIDITGATITAAVAALAKSVPSRRPKFLVFHRLAAVSSVPDEGVTVDAGKSLDVFGAAAANCEVFSVSNGSCEADRAASSPPTPLSFILLRF